MLSGVHDSQSFWIYHLASTDQLNVPFKAILSQKQPKYCLPLTLLLLAYSKHSLFHPTLHLHYCKINRVVGKNKTFRIPLFSPIPFNSNHEISCCQHIPCL